MIEFITIELVDGEWHVIAWDGDLNVLGTGTARSRMTAYIEAVSNAHAV